MINLNKRRVRNTGLALMVTALSFGGYLAFLQLSGNFHTVVPGEFYRSAQPSASQLEDYASRYGIKTVINLRGKNDKAAWYNEEIAVAERLGIQHIDFAMSASAIVTHDVAEQLVEVMKSAPKPILIHCKAGADRSGIVSAIYSHQIAGFDQDRAERQLSVFFGHIGIPYLSSTFAMDESWENLEAHFNSRG
jgi:protein tyrosine/serine phosphatase